MHGTIIKEINNEQVNSLPLYMDFILQDLLEEKKKRFFFKEKGEIFKWLGQKLQVLVKLWLPYIIKEWQTLSFIPQYIKLMMIYVRIIFLRGKKSFKTKINGLWIY